MMHRQETRDSCVLATHNNSPIITRSSKPSALCRSMSRSTSSRRASSTRSSLSRPLISRSSGSHVVSNVHDSPAASTWSSSSSTSLPTSSSSSTGSSSSTSTSTSLLSVLAWSMTLLLVSSCLGIADAGALMGHPFSKRSFMDIQCKGVYDKSLFARLDRICEDCYNLFREPQLHTLCRKNCFTSDYFKGCLDVLLLQDEMEWIQTSIKQLHGADPGV